MADLYRYLEYREFLRDDYEEKHANVPGYSYRYLASKLGVDSSYLIRLQQCKKHISEDLIGPLCEILNLDARQSVYFGHLVAFNKARTDAQARTFYEQLLKCRQVNYQVVEAERAEYFNRWYVVAMRSLLDHHPFQGDFTLLARQFSPQITLRQAKEAFYLLKTLGMVEETENGWIPKEGHYHSGTHWSGDLVRKFQSECIHLAARSLRQDPPHCRDISTMTMNVNGDHIERLRILIQEFQDAVIKLVEPPAPCDRVVQLNVQLFPLTQIRSEVHS